ncbi:MAG: DUF2283 domain-containing protein [Candidatus Bathyarchaeota archaeon]|nr:DUF2283 domain-containing protein [Candidatus Bathyarchaeota archaeon]MDW8040725.1 DUF2283 domain-containing protein [Nitrososphaerota archaeon]
MREKPLFEDVERILELSRNFSQKIADPDIHLELDEKGEIIGIEIWNAAKSGLIKQVAKAIAEAPA